MKIRAKLLILLLVIAVTPLLFTTIYGFVTVRNMGDSLADQIGDALKDRMKHQLQLMVRYNAKMLQQKQELVEAWLKLLADAAQKTLSAGNPASEPAYLATDFDTGRVPARQVHPSTRHFELDSTGDARPIPVSTEAQVLNIAPGVDPDAIADSIPRLSSLTHVYKSGYDRHPNLFYWIYTSLENGLHSAFPGHGGYPEDYDGRKRPWYKNAVSTGDTVWSEFLIDATTGQAVATASRPIFYPDGRLAGVAAIDVPLQAMLNEIRMQADISKDVSVFLTRASTEHGNPALEVMAALAGEHKDWREVPASRVLSVVDPGFFTLVEDIAAGRSGVTRIAYQGRDSVWAYGIFDNLTQALVVVFPFADVEQRVEAARDYVQGETLGIVSIVGLFVLVLTGLIIAAAWGSSMSITEPLRDLAGAARRLAKGDFGVSVPVRSKDEIGQLSAVFNDIAPQLLDRIKARESLAHLGRYFSPNLAEQLTENPGLLGVGGERREMTFVFTDLAGFTALVETSEPEIIMPVLNDYLDGMMRIVWRHEGTIDKVVGDAVHAMFGAPLDQPDHAARGVQCAMDMDRYAESFRAGMREKGVEIGVTRIGVNTGVVTVGNFGGELMFDYTAHGDAINTAARLESANRFYGTRITVSENTSRLVDGFVGRPIGKLVLKGRSVGLKTFEPLPPDSYRSERIQAYLDAYSAIVDGDHSAVKKFQALGTAYPDDLLARFHMLRLEAGERGEAVTLAGK